MAINLPDAGPRKTRTVIGAGKLVCLDGEDACSRRTGKANGVLDCCAYMGR